MSGSLDRLENVNAYLEDEFDRLAQERQTLGAHRKPTRVSPWLVALVAVLLIAPLAGWGVGKWISSDSSARETVASVVTPEKDKQTEQGKDKQTEQNSSTPDKAGQAPAEPKKEEAPPAPPTPAEPEKPALNKNVNVRVLNGKGISGLAAEVQGQLKEAGYANVTADNYKGGNTPTTTTIYYKNADMKAMAEDIAQHLGRGTVAEGDGVSMSADIVVVLR